MHQDFSAVESRILAYLEKEGIERVIPSQVNDIFNN